MKNIFLSDDFLEYLLLFKQVARISETARTNEDARILFSFYSLQELIKKRIGDDFEKVLSDFKTFLNVEDE
jgi:hypothetical protein